YEVNSATASVANVYVQPFDPFKVQSGGGTGLDVFFDPQVEGAGGGQLQLPTGAQGGGGDGGARGPVDGGGGKARGEVPDQKLDFGNVPLETVGMSALRLRNPSEGDAPSRVELEGPDADEYSIGAPAGEWVMPAGTEQSLAVAFKPTRLGATEARAKV